MFCLAFGLRPPVPRSLKACMSTGALFETESVEDTRPVVPLYPVKWNLVDPIMIDEISRCLKDTGASAPDNVSTALLKAKPGIHV